MTLSQLCKKINKTPDHVFENRVIFEDGTSINNLKAFLK